MYAGEAHDPLQTVILISPLKASTMPTSFQSDNYSDLLASRFASMFCFCLPMLDATSSLHPALVATVKKLQTGYISGTRCILLVVHFAL